MNDQSAETLLNQLKGIETPSVSALPAPGWWVVLVLLIILLLAALWLRKQYKAALWHRQARDELQRIRAAMPAQPVSDTLADTSKLLRRIALKARGRDEAAGLVGREWLSLLDSLSERQAFTAGFGQLLETGPYQREVNINSQDVDALLDAVDELIRHVRRQHRWRR